MVDAVCSHSAHGMTGRTWVTWSRATALQPRPVGPAVRESCPGILIRAFRLWIPAGPSQPHSAGPAQFRVFLAHTVLCAHHQRVPCYRRLSGHLWPPGNISRSCQNEMFDCHLLASSLCKSAIYAISQLGWRLCHQVLSCRVHPVGLYVGLLGGVPL